MESIRSAIASEANTGKVRADRIYRILSDLVDAVETLIDAPVAPTPVPVPVAAEPQAAVPSPDPEAAAPEVPAQPAPAPVRMFGKPA